jgi:hypothetical protein
MPERVFTCSASRPKTIRTDGKAGFIDSVDVQFSVRVNVPIGVTLARKVIEEAIKYKATHGKNPKGFQITLIQWRNPDRRKGNLQDVYLSPVESKGGKGWRSYGSQKERFQTLARGLRGPHTVYTVTEHRAARGKK